MNIPHYIQIAFWMLLIAGAAIYASGRKKYWKKSLSHRRVLIKDKKMKEGTVQVQLLSAASLDPGINAPDSAYVVRIKLKTYQPITENKLLQHMNFGMRKCFFAVQGGDTLEQTACEKIPCIDRNEYIYMTCFNKAEAITDSKLLIYVADSLIGFGNSKFEFTSKALQQLDHNF